MKEEYKDLLSDFATSVINRDYDSAYTFFSSGLKKAITQEEFQEVMEKHFLEINEEWNLENNNEYPAHFEMDGNKSLGYEHFLNEESNYSLFRVSEKIPSDITKDNFEYWASISFLVSEEQAEYLDFDGWFDFWCIIIKTKSKYEIGYFELHELD